MTSIVVRISADGSFTPADLEAAVASTLHEVFPTDDGFPVVPKVERATPYGEGLVAGILDGEYPDFDAEGNELPLRA